MKLRLDDKMAVGHPRTNHRT